MKTANAKNLFYTSVISIGLSALSLSFIPFGSFAGSDFQRIIAYIIGIVFWLGIIVGYCLFIIVARTRKKSKKQKLLPKTENIRIGVLSFFKTFPGMIADIVCAISVVALIITVVFGNSSTWIVYVLVSVLIFSIQMHGIFNGINFVYIKSYKKEEKKNG